MAFQVGVLSDSTCYSIAEKACGGKKSGVVDLVCEGAPTRFWISSGGSLAKPGDDGAPPVLELYERNGCFASNE